MFSFVLSEKRVAKRQLDADFEAFLRDYPQYADTCTLDRLRKTEFSRVDKAREFYVDYMGGCLWPKSLVTNHANILKSGIFGNTHSDSPCAARSDRQIYLARAAVLKFFDAPSPDYVCIFTSNATNALKLVGESFPFGPNSVLLLPADCHNSVNGLRKFAHSAGATVEYLESTPFGGFDQSEALDMLSRNASSCAGSPSLFVLTGQSNITGIRPSMSILSDAKKAGFSTLVDAASLASSTRISLRDLPHADAIAVSFYKMFGYPTGVGALVAKKSFLATLKRKWFSGGTVDFVQAPGDLTLHASDLTARFEEGSLNYSSLSAIAPGLEFVSKHMPDMSIRLPILHHYLHNALESLVYPGTQTRLVRVLTRPRLMPTSMETISATQRRPLSRRSSRRSPSPQNSRPGTPLRRSLSVFSHLSPFSSSSGGPPSSSERYPEGPNLDTTTHSSFVGQGYVVSCTFYTSSGETIPLSHVSHLASRSGISLRTGCVCNPGGAAALRGKDIQERMERLSVLRKECIGDDEGREERLRRVGEIMIEAGVVRLSLGMASNFEDVWRVVTWAKSLLDETKRERDLASLTSN